MPLWGSAVRPALYHCSVLCQKRWWQRDPTQKVRSLAWDHFLSSREVKVPASINSKSQSISSLKMKVFDCSEFWRCILQRFLEAVHSLGSIFSVCPCAQAGTAASVTFRTYFQAFSLQHRGLWMLAIQKAMKEVGVFLCSRANQSCQRLPY